MTLHHSLSLLQISTSALKDPLIAQTFVITTMGHTAVRVTMDTTYQLKTMPHVLVSCERSLFFFYIVIFQ